MDTWSRGRSDTETSSFEQTLTTMALRMGSGSISTIEIFAPGWIVHHTDHDRGGGEECEKKRSWIEVLLEHTQCYPPVGHSCVRKCCCIHTQSLVRAFVHTYHHAPSRSREHSNKRRELKTAHYTNKVEVDHRVDPNRKRYLLMKSTPAWTLHESRRPNSCRALNAQYTKLVEPAHRWK